MKDITSKSTITCRKIFASYGLSQIVVTDYGKSFTSSEFKEFLKENSINLHCHIIQLQIEFYANFQASIKTRAQ